MPGLVMLHEHLYYPTGPGVYGQLGQSFVRLYLAGGVTTMRTGGNVNGVMDITLAKRHRGGAGGRPGDRRHRAVPERTEHVRADALARDADDARSQVNYWADMGATSFKAYMQITRAELGAAIDEAHKRGMKVTGHLCSVTLRGSRRPRHRQPRARLLRRRPTSSPTKQPDVCPGSGAPASRRLPISIPTASRSRALVKTLIDKKVALTSTLTVFETFTPGRPMPPGLDVLVPPLREQFEQTFARVREKRDVDLRALFPKGMALERAFARAGGLLVAGHGSDRVGRRHSRLLEPAADRAARRGRVHAARSDHDRDAERREVSRPRDEHRQSIAVGKQADLVLASR